MEFKDFLFDSHAHLNSFTSLDNAAEPVSRSKASGVEEIWDIGTDIESSKKSIELAKKYPEIKSFVGVDPELFVPGSSMFLGFESGLIAENMEELRKLIEGNREHIFGIGETGVDNYWIQKLDVESQKTSLNLQTELFSAHIELAKEYKLQMTIHSRNYEEDCLEILKRNNSGFTIFHSYTGSYETAKAILDAGYCLGVNGIITFKNASELKETYRKLLGNVPSGVGPKYFYDKGIFFETDAPFLSPEGKRGEQNEPSNVRAIFDAFVSMLQ